MTDTLIVVLKLFSDLPTLVYATPNSIVVEEGQGTQSRPRVLPPEIHNQHSSGSQFLILVTQLVPILYLPFAMHRKATKDHMYAELAIYLAHIMPLLLQMCNVSE